MRTGRSGLDDYSEQLRRELERKAEAERRRTVRGRRMRTAIENAFRRMSEFFSVELDSPRDYMRTWWRLRLGDGFAPVAVPGVLLSVFITVALLSLDPEIRFADAARDFLQNPGPGGAFWFGVIVLSCAAVLYGLLAMLAYRNWRLRAAFIVEGWTDLIRHPDLDNDRWLPARVIVRLAENSPGDFAGRASARSGAAAALGLWGLDARRSYYSIDEASDPRRPWSVTEDSAEQIVARGHLNIFAVYRLQRWLRGTLARLQASTRGGIAAVRLEIEGPSIYLSRPSAD